MGWFTRNALDRPATSARCKIVALLAVALLTPLQAVALDAPAQDMQRLTEDELRRVSAQGLADRFLQRISRYTVNGLGIEVLGDMASLLNPLDGFAGLIDAETTFRDAVFNPNNPSMLVDQDGSVLVRLPSSVGEINVRNIRVHGSNGTSFGSVTIRDVNFGGTTIRVTRR